MFRGGDANRRNSLNTIGGTLLLAMSMLLFGCELTDDEKNAINDNLNPPHVDPPPPDSSDPLAPLCYEESFYQPVAEVTKKIDLLFVMDTSGSLDNERKDIARGIGAFVDELPEEADFRMGLLLAHGGKSRYSGKLYQARKEPTVLDSMEMSIGELRDKLLYKLKKIKGDGSTDGGEAGLYSLQKALTEELESNREKGFFREDAALAVVFVADENDICAIYPEGVKRVKDPQGVELPAFERYCEDVTPQSVYDNIKSVNGELPLLVSGIVYHEKSDYRHSGENEIGYGYLETIDLNNGLAVDLAGGEYHIGLKEIGSLVTKKLKLRTEFELGHGPIEEHTLSVKVDGMPVEFDYFEASNEVHLTDHAGGEKSLVQARYCVEGDEGSGPYPDPSPAPSPAPGPGTGMGPGPSPAPANDLPPNPEDLVDEDGDGYDDETGYPLY